MSSCRSGRLQDLIKEMSRQGGFYKPTPFPFFFPSRLTTLSCLLGGGLAEEDSKGLTCWRKRCHRVVLLSSRQLQAEVLNNPRVHITFHGRPSASVSY